MQKHQSKLITVLREPEAKKFLDKHRSERARAERERRGGTVDKPKQRAHREARMWNGTWEKAY